MADGVAFGFGALSFHLELLQTSVKHLCRSKHGVSGKSAFFKHIFDPLYPVMDFQRCLA